MHSYGVDTSSTILCRRLVTSSVHRVADLSSGRRLQSSSSDQCSNYGVGSPDLIVILWAACLQSEWTPSDVEHKVMHKSAVKLRPIIF